MVRLKRLVIRKYRHVQPGTKLRFADGFNVVLGQNGTGKTTLLELLALLVRADFSDLPNEPVDLEYEFESEHGTAVVTVVNEEQEPRSPALELPTDLPGGLPRDSSSWRVRTSVILKDKDHNKVVDSRDEEPGRALMNTRPLLAAAWVAQDSPLQEMSGELVMLSGLRFDESLDVFSSMTDRWSFTVEIRRDSDIPRSGHLNITDPSPLEFWRFFLKQVEEEPSRDRLEITHLDSPLLTKVVEQLGLSAARLHVDRRERKRQGNVDVIEFAGLTIEFTKKDGDVFTHRALSYGQKRLVAFYFYLASRTQIVIADELVNGLHHRWIDACLAEIGQRQAFLTSQNPLLLDYLSFDDAASVQASFVRCDSSLVDGREHWTWRNLTEEEAQNVFAAYEVGIQQVSEILLVRGLW